MQREQLRSAGQAFLTNPAMIPARRRWLAGLLGLAAGRLWAGAAARAHRIPARILRRWASGDAELAPVAAVDARHIVCAGARTLALHDWQEARPLWYRAHDLPGAAVFRPRLAAATLVCGGQQAIGAWQLVDGRPLWQYRARQEIGAPCLHSGRVFLGDGHELVCLDLSSGQERWRFAAVADTLISYAPAARAATVFVGPGDGRLYALDIDSGRPRWILDLMGEWQYLRQLQVDGDLLIAGSYKEILYGIDIASGRVRWRFNAGNFINSQHVAAGNVYFWSPTGWLYALETATGRLRWRQRTNDYGGGADNWAPLLAELVTSQDRLYALDLENVLHLLDASRGTMLAHLALPVAIRPFVLPLTRHEALLATDDGELLRVDTK